MRVREDRPGRDRPARRGAIASTAPFAEAGIGGYASTVQASESPPPPRHPHAADEGTPSPLLAGKRILLVEDEFIVATMAEDMLSELGATVVGPATSLARGLALAENEEIDAAVLDINIQGTTVDPVADILSRRGIPFIFATGYGRPALRDRSQQAPLLDKPYTVDKLAAMLTGLLGEA